MFWVGKKKKKAGVGHGVGGTVPVASILGGWGCAGKPRWQYQGAAGTSTWPVYLC